MSKVRLSASIEIIGVDVDNGTKQIKKAISKSFGKDDLTYDTTITNVMYFDINTPLCIPRLMELFPSSLGLSVNGNAVNMKMLK